MDRLLARPAAACTVNDLAGGSALAEGLGASSSRLYVTPEEATELHAEMMKTFERLVGTAPPFCRAQGSGAPPARLRARRFVLLGYPVLDAPRLPDEGETDEERTTARRAEPRPRPRQKCQTRSA